jgi:hypothetical protein
MRDVWAGLALLGCAAAVLVYVLAVHVAGGLP